MKARLQRWITLTTLLITASFSTPSAAMADPIADLIPLLQTDEHIVFVGDSITYFGGKAGGYIDRIDRALSNQINIQHYSVSPYSLSHYGLSGGKVADLWTGKTQWSESLPYDQILQTTRPTLLILYIGVNDVWHEAGTAPAVYRSGLVKLIQQGQATGATVILATPAVIGEKRNGGNPKDKMLDQFSQISRSASDETGIIVCDLRQAFQDYLALHNPTDRGQGILTSDGVHMNAKGNTLIAETMLRSMAQALAERATP
jgi:isoamyl acetate esterase